MPVNLPAPLRRALRTGDLVAGEHLVRASPIDASLRRILLADLKRQAGAAGQAAQLLESGSPPHDLSLRLVTDRVRGEVLAATGAIDEAIDVLGRTILEGDALGEREQVALAALSRFTVLASHRGLLESQQGLETAKRAVLKAGDAQLMASLHARVGQAHAQRSLPTLAVSELHSALRLLEPEPNASIEAFIQLALSGAEYLLARNREASARASAAYSIADLNGLNGLKAAAQANLAFLECRRGRLRKARQLAQALLPSVPPLSLARGALSDTLANVALATGELGSAADAVRAIEEVIQGTRGSTLLLVDSAPARADLARRHQRLAEATAILTAARDAAEQRGDRLKWAKLTLLRAELRAEAMQARASSEDVQEVLDTVPHPSAEVLALLARARACRAVAASDVTRARAEFARAMRVFSASGDIFHERQTQRMQGELVPAQTPSSSTVRKRVSGQLRLCESLSFVCGLLPHPHIAGAEAVRMLRRLKVVKAANVRRYEVGEPTELPGHSNVQLGTVGGDQFVLTAVPSDGADARETLAHVVQVLRLSVLAVKAHVDSASRVLSWEVDVAAEGAEGLYISPPMKQLFASIKRAAASSAHILVTGETGTGKEIVARELHVSSARAQKPFIALNVTAVPRDMLEGQLFGYRRGAFTGAVSDHRGLIRDAEGGTLFIDEIGELSPDLQPKLLRFLESGEIQPLGERPQRVDVRIVAATNARLDALVKAGRFREDLYYRLNVITLVIPPLRERREEIPTLINFFLTRHARDAGKPIPQLTPQALERLSAYDWPGNVRQLTNELKRLVAMHDENELVDVEHLAAAIRQPVTIAAPALQDAISVQVRLDQPLQAMYDDIERAAIDWAMRESRSNQSEAALRLGITRKGLYLKRRRLGLSDDSQP